MQTGNSGPATAPIGAAAPSGRREHLDRFAVALLVGCCLFWGFQQVLVKATLAEVAPVFQAAIRFAGATGLLLLWCAWRGVRLWQRDGTLAAGLAAGLLFSGEFACVYSGLAYTSASRLTVFMYCSPFWVALLLPLFVPSERLRRAQWIGLSLALGGVAFALGDRLGAGSPPQRWLGDLLAVAAGLLWALTTVVIRSTSLVRVSAEKLLFYQVACSTVALPLLSLALGESWTWRFSAFAAASLALQTVVGAFASYLVWMWMLGHYPATKITAFVFLTPVFALVFGTLWLDETVTLRLLLALALVAVGIVLVSRRPRAMD